MTEQGAQALRLGEDLAFDVDTSIYELDSILRAAYRLTDRCYVFLARDPQNPQRLTIYLGVKPPAGSDRTASRLDVTALAGELSNELIDQQLRTVLAREAGPVRELIVAQAFAEGNLLDPERDDGDYRQDPHGIG